MNLVEVKNIRHSFQNRDLFQNLSFEIRENEILGLVGPSGCGKSTLLKIISRTLTPTQGIVQRSEHLQFGYVFQDHRLLPWKTVEENILFAAPESKDKDLSDRLLKRVGLFESKSQFPHEISGGMRMRTSIVRALMNQPQLLLLDEPFSALDEWIRWQLQDLCLSLQREKKFSAILVTHSLTEASQLCDRVLVLNTQGGKHELIDFGHRLIDRNGNLAFERLLILRNSFHQSLGENHEI